MHHAARFMSQYHVTLLNVMTLPLVLDLILGFCVLEDKYMNYVNLMCQYTSD
jgi:hypothetical protein